MSRLFELKDINFLAFTQRLEYFSQQWGLKNVSVSPDNAVFRWDRSLLGLGFGVELEKIDDNSFIWFYDLGAVSAIIAVAVLFFYLIFKPSWILFIGLGLFLAIVIVLLDRYIIEKNLMELFRFLEKNSIPVQSKEEESGTGPRCPACGEALTEYDEFCPSCGLYLGKVWKKQPVHRTGLYNVRLEYKYKKKD